MNHFQMYSLPSTTLDLPPKNAAQFETSLIPGDQGGEADFGEFIYLASRHEDENNQLLQRSQTHAMSIPSFLQGKTPHTPPTILSAGTRVRMVEQMHLGQYLCSLHFLYTLK
jgi:hypothetical protein